MTNTEVLVEGRPCPVEGCGVTVETVVREDRLTEGPRGPASDIESYTLIAQPCGHTRKYTYQ
jgi:hypothetical protein